MSQLWTPPYHGVTHAIINKRQCTVVAYPSFVEATVFPRTGESGFFTTGVKEGTYEDVESAKAWCEKVAKGELTDD